MTTCVEEKIVYWLALQDVSGIGPNRIKKLFDEYRSISLMLNTINSTSGPEWWQNIKTSLEVIDKNKYKKIIDLTYEIGGKICTLEDPEYPINLRRSQTAPAVLFYKGSLDKLSPRSLALVGTVNPSDEGILRAHRFAKNCAENNIQVVSGLARGIDTASHKAALKHAGLTYAVVGHGIDHCYPPENKELFEEITRNGAVISHFATGTKPQPWMFPSRNETMCTISSGTVIIEAEDKCGSLIQAKHSFRHGRRVYLLNSNIQPETKWATELVNKGAWIVKDFDIVLKGMSEVSQAFVETPETKVQLEFDLTDNQQSENIKALLFDMDGVLLDSLPILEECYRAVCCEMGKNEIDINLLRNKITNAPPYVLQCMGVDKTKGNHIFKKKYLALLQSSTRFFPDVPEAIRELKKKGYRIGIVTSQPLNRYKAVIENAPFKNAIDTAITWNDLPSNQQKPHPAGILKALKMLGIKPENAAYVGDTKKDVEASKNAGVRSVVVSWGYEPLSVLSKSYPDIIVKNPFDLTQIIL